MIKKILVALDPDSDTPVATRFAADIAERHGASVTGLAVVDLGSIEAGTKGGGIGSFYYAEKLRDKLTSETRSKALELIAAFQRAIENADVEHIELVQEGVPFERIIEDMKYHDLLVIGKNPHFFYGHPKQSTETLARVVKNTAAPALIVGSSYATIRKAVIAFDGSEAAVRTLKGFLYTTPFGPDVEIHVVNVYSKNPADSELTLTLAETYIKAHGFECRTMALKADNVKSALLDYVRDVEADLLVAGAHAISGIRKLALGSITEKLIADCPLPMLVDN